ncbi:MAG: DUF1292 domain-containing protein [Lachnospiraceae bacterium]|jgi:uncharacterized protein YrzB (UPF0473 family)|nr:DUF1292 domain-containing protein [Lachnospiraceae bacterium]MEE3460994.1 DUF1292 domain-containing protein [Lachnospiraceae bacterium]
MDEENVIEFTDEDGNVERLYVLNYTEINGTGYYLVSDDKNAITDEDPEDNNDFNKVVVNQDGSVGFPGDDDDPVELNCFLLKEVASDGDEVTCEPVDDDDEVEAVSKVFAELMDEDIE